MVRKAPKGFKNKAKGGKGKSLSKKAISDISKATRFAESIGSDKKFSDLAKQYKQYDVKYPDRPPTFRASYGDEVNKVGTPLASTYYKDPVTGEERFFTAQAPTFKQLMGDIGRGLFSGYNTLSYDPNAGGIPTTTGGQIVRRQGLFPLLANKAMSGEFGLMGLAKGLYDRFKSGTQQGIETVGGLYDNLRSAFSGQPTVNYGGGSTITTTTNQPVIDLTPASIETETLPSMDLNRNIGNESDQSIFGITNTGVPLPFLRSTTDLPYNNISSFNPDTYQPGYLPEGYSNVGVAPIIPEYYQPNNTLGNIFLNSQGYEVPISNDLMSKRRPPSYLEQQDNYYYQNRPQSLPTGQQYYYADASQQDIDRINKMRQLKGMDPQSIYDMRDIFQLSPELTLEDIQGIKEGTITQPTGIFAKYGGSVDKYAGLGYKLK